MKANQDRLYKDVDFLTSLNPPRNYRNVKSLDKAARYIESELSKAGAEPQVQTWTVSGNTYQNIIA